MVESLQASRVLLRDYRDAEGLGARRVCGKRGAANWRGDCVGAVEDHGSDVEAASAWRREYCRESAVCLSVDCLAR